MAKTNGPLFSNTASGSIGPCLTFSLRKSGQQVRFQAKQKDKKSTLQIFQRALYSQAVDSWIALSDNEKREWKVAAVGLPMSGFNLYVREYLKNPPVTFSYLLATHGSYLLQENTSKIIL